MADVALGQGQVGDQGAALFRVEARSAAGMRLGWYDTGSRRRVGFVDLAAASPFAISGSFDTLPADATPAQIRLRVGTFLVAPGDRVRLTDGQYMIVRVVGSEDPGAQLPPGVWSPSDNLRPQYTIGDIEHNYGASGALP